eukprot:2451214-Prymnesium_polylepis.1
MGETGDWSSAPGASAPPSPSCDSCIICTNIWRSLSSCRTVSGGELARVRARQRVVAAAVAGSLTYLRLREHAAACVRVSLHSATRLVRGGPPTCAPKCLSRRLRRGVRGAAAVPCRRPRAGTSRGTRP